MSDDEVRCLRSAGYREDQIGRSDAEVDARLRCGLESITESILEPGFVELYCGDLKIRTNPSLSSVPPTIQEIRDLERCDEGVTDHDRFFGYSIWRAKFSPK